MENPPMKTINYGQTQHIIYYDYEINYYDKPRKNSKTMDRKSKQLLAPYLIDMDKNKKINNILKQYKKMFQRFVKEETETIKRKDKEIKIYYYKISQAFLSYIKQSKDLIEPQMIEEEYEEILSYKIKDYDKQIKNYPKIELEDHMGFTYEKKIEIKGNNVKIKNKNYRKLLINNIARLYESKHTKINNYKILIKELQKYYKKINPQNNNWDEYLQQEVKKMINLLKSDDELEKLQKEYKEYNKQKVKNGYNR